MANAIKYSESVVPLTLRKGDFYLLTGNEIFGTTSATGFWNGYDLTNVKYVIYLNRPSNGPSIYAPANDNELIAITNKIANTNYSTASECIVWFATQSDKMVVNKTYPPIVTNGLVLNLDAGFLPSYPTSGTTWYDLSGNNAYSSLFNGPIFNSQGYLDFDGTDDYGLVVGVGLSTTAYTKIAWFKPDTATNNIISGGGDGQHAFWMAGTSNNLQAGHNGSWNTVSYIPGNMTGSWWCGAVTFNTSTGWVLYLNGNIVDTDSNTTTFTGGNAIRIAAYNNASNLFNGKISQAQVYNRVLSASEVLQNYYQAPIVTDGLIFAVDAGNIVSYESGSTTTYSLIGSNNGSLLNGTTYTQDGGGTWVFDGVDDQIQFSGSSTYNTANVTVESWVKLNSDGSRHIIFANWGGFALEVNPNGSVVFFTNSTGQGQVGAVTSANSLSWDVWTYLVGMYDSSSSEIRTYVNGVLLATRSSTNSIVYSQTPNRKISPIDYSGGIVNGNVSIVRQYNKSLTQQEVSQNFNAQRSRFGI